MGHATLASLSPGLLLRFARFFANDARNGAKRHIDLRVVRFIDLQRHTVLLSHDVENFSVNTADRDHFVVFLEVSQQIAVFLLLAPFAGIHISPERFLVCLGTLFVVGFGLTGLGFLVAWPMESTQGFHAIMNVFLIPLWLMSGALLTQQPRLSSRWSISPPNRRRASSRRTSGPTRT